VVKNTIYFDFGEYRPAGMSRVEESGLWKLSSR